MPVRLASVGSSVGLSRLVALSRVGPTGTDNTLADDAGFAFRCTFDGDGSVAEGLEAGTNVVGIVIGGDSTDEGELVSTGAAPIAAPEADDVRVSS